ncbi:MAG: DegV family protein, partial [Anaerolineales bacterium]|nr:DegV family protein [Anaerolineales bacterium]
MKLGIVTDSTSDLPKYLAEQHEIEVIPTILILDGKEYADGNGISRDDFYDQLPSLRTPPTTAAPSIGDFASRYDSLFARGCDHVISIHPPGKLTTIVNSARQAAQDFPNKITVLDSGSLSLGLGFQALAAAEAAENGLDAALGAIKSTRERLKVYAALDTMEYLKRSGRVPGAVATLGGLLSIKPLIELAEGEVKAIGAVRTTSQANQRMLNLLLQGGGQERLAVLHTGAESRAKDFLNTLMQTASQSVPRDILLVNVTTVIGTHVGPHGLGFAVVRKL